MIYVIYSEKGTTIVRKCDTFASANSILTHVLEGIGKGETKLFAVIDGKNVDYRIEKVTFNILNSEA